MTRRLVPWLVSVPLMLGGTELAHWLAFRIVYPSAFARAQALAQSGHGDLAWLPSLAGAGLVLVLTAVVLVGRAGRRREQLVPVPRPHWFAALPPLAFASQEHLESVFHGGSLLGVVLEPTFMLGLILQLPFALLAYLAARLLLGVAREVGARLSPAVARPRTPPTSRRRVDALVLPYACLLGAGHSGAAHRATPRCGPRPPELDPSLPAGLSRCKLEEDPACSLQVIAGGPRPSRRAAHQSVPAT